MIKKLKRLLLRFSGILGGCVLSMMIVLIAINFSKHLQWSLGNNLMFYFIVSLVFPIFGLIFPKKTSPYVFTMLMFLISLDAGGGDGGGDSDSKKSVKKSKQLCRSIIKSLSEWLDFTSVGLSFFILIISIFINTKIPFYVAMGLCSYFTFRSFSGIIWENFKDEVSF